MTSNHPRMLTEARTIAAMVEIYCRGKHGTKGNICPDCAEFLEYSYMRLDKCIYQEKKPTCGNCRIHCYKPVMKEKVKEVMRYAGPRMLLRHPFLALYHFLYGFKKAPPVGRR